MLYFSECWFDLIPVLERLALRPVFSFALTLWANKMMGGAPKPVKEEGSLRGRELQKTKMKTEHAMRLSVQTPPNQSTPSRTPWTSYAQVCHHIKVPPGPSAQAVGEGWERGRMIWMHQRNPASLMLRVSGECWELVGEEGKGGCRWPVKQWGVNLWLQKGEQPPEALHYVLHLACKV